MTTTLVATPDPLTWETLPVWFRDVVIEGLNHYAAMMDEYKPAMKSPRFFWADDVLAADFGIFWIRSSREQAEQMYAAGRAAKEQL